MPGSSSASVPFAQWIGTFLGTSMWPTLPLFTSGLDQFDISLRGEHGQRRQSDHVSECLFISFHLLTFQLFHVDRHSLQFCIYKFYISLTYTFSRCILNKLFRLSQHSGGALAGGKESITTSKEVCFCIKTSSLA